MVQKSMRSFRLTHKADDMLQKLADKFGIGKTAMLEVLIRDQFHREFRTHELERQAEPSL